MNALLQTRGLTAFYGDAQALFGIDFQVDQGEMVAIIGANGAGKSTFMKAVTGLLAVQPAQILWQGQPIGGMSASEIAKRGIALVPEGRRLFSSLNVEENLLMGECAERKGVWNLLRVYELFPRLAERRSHMGNQISGGEQQMLSIGRALMGDPAILLLDEPMEGLAPIIVEMLMQALTRLIREEALTVVLVEQSAKLALQVTEDVLVLSRGRIIHSGKSAELLAQPDRLAQLIVAH